MRRGSSLLRPYLDCTQNPATRYTPGTFLAYTLQGRAARYSNKYLQVLMRDLEREEAAGKAMRVQSVRGGVAWIQISPGLTPNVSQGDICWPCTCCGVPIPGDGSIYHPGSCPDCWEDWLKLNPAAGEVEEGWDPS